MDVKPKVNDVWVDKGGNEWIIHSTEHSSFYPYRGVNKKGDATGTWTSDLKWTVGMTCVYDLVSKIGEQATDPVESLNYFRSIMNPDRPVKSVFDVMKERLS